MAENSKLTGIELNGVLYSLGKSIYEELDISLIRFAELLGRDFYCPTLSSAPTPSTLKYLDTDGEEQTFQVGQPCRWADGSGYRIAICKDITSAAAAWYILPTNVSELINDSGYLTQHQDISHLATKSELNSKVDKESGKQLSTEDFTTALKEKLDGLNNYDDTTISNAVSSLQTQFDTLVNGNPSAAINSFNEIISFLEGIADSEDLESIIASIEQQIAAKQEKISDLEAIRSGATKGETAVQPSSLSAVATSGSYNDLTDKPSVIPVEQGGTGATTKESACDNIGAAKQYYMQKGLSKEGWYRIGLLTAVMSTSSARIVVGGTNADVSPIIMDFQHNFRGDMLSQMPTVMTPLYVTKVRACRYTSDDMYIDVYFTNVASSMTTVSVFPLEGTFEPMNFADVTNESVSVATVIDVVKDGFLSDRATTGALNDKQDKVIKFTNKTASLWVSDNTYTGYPYRCDVTCDGVTAEMYADVVFSVEHSTSGNYAPVCETKANVVSVWSSEDTTITIPTIIITK